MTMHTERHAMSTLILVASFVLIACDKEDLTLQSPEPPGSGGTAAIDSTTQPYPLAVYDPGPGADNLKSLSTLHGDRVFLLRDDGADGGLLVLALDTANLVLVDSVALPSEMNATPFPYIEAVGDFLVVSTFEGTVALDPKNLRAPPRWRVTDIGSGRGRVLRHGHHLYSVDGVDDITRRLVQLDLRDGSHRDVFTVRDQESRRGRLIGAELSGLAIAPHADGRGDILYTVYRRHDGAIDYVPGWTGQNRQDIYAVDLASGRQLWMAHDTVAFAIPNSSSTVFPNAVFDSVLVVRTSHEFVGLNRFTGDKIWGIELAERYGWRDAQGRPVGYTGHGAEPEVGDGVIVVIPSGGRRVVAGIDPYTGEDRWRHENVFDVNIHKSERLPGGDRIHLAWSGGALQRYDPQTGALRWRVKSPYTDSIPEGTYTLGFHLDAARHAIYVGDHHRFFKLRIPPE